MKKSFIYIFVIFLTIQNVLSINPFVKNFNKKIYKAGSQNWDIIQHKNDWMYFANNNGLLEFDGSRWTIYPVANNTMVRCLYYDEKNDIIYAGASNEFGYYKRNNSGFLVYHSLRNKIKKEDLNFNEIWNIHENEGALYFQGDNEIFKYKNDIITRIPFKTKIECSAIIRNSLYVSGITEGVNILNGDMFLKLPQSEVLNNKKICAILPYEKNKVLFVTDFYGIFVFDGKKVERLKLDIDNFLSENQVFCATIKNNKIAFGTVRNGVVVKDFESGENIYSNTSSGQQNNTVLSLKFDNLENLWLGLDKGIDYVLVNSPIYNLIGNNGIIGTGYASLAKGKILYLGTNQGLYHTNFPIHYSPNQIDIKIINGMQGQVWSLTEIDNTIFCGTDHGAYIIEGKEAKQIPGVLGTWSFKELKQKPGHILASSYQGFFILKKENGKWKFGNFVKGFPESGGMFEEDPNGSIWFSHWMKGVFKIRLNDKLNTVLSAEHFGTKEGFPFERTNLVYTIDNQIVFSTDNGFYQYNERKNRMELSKRYNEILNIKSLSMRLFQDNKKNIWFVSNWFVGASFLQKDQTFKLDTTSFSFLKNNLVSGFESFNFVDNEKIIVSTEDGFSWIDMSKINSQQKHKIKPYISNISFTKDGDSIVASFHNNEDKRELKFKYKNNSLRFEFTVPEYRNENLITYSYLLENYDTEWSSYSASNTKEYTKLRKGDYTFRIRAKSTLEAEPVETFIRFTILPPWYQSNIAYLIYFLLIVSFIVKLIFFVNKRFEEGALEMKIQKEKEMKEQEERFQEDSKQKEKEIIALKNQKLQYELRHKSQELASSTMNLIRKNEILLEVNQKLDKISSDIESKTESVTVLKRLQKMQEEIKKNIENDNNWKRFEENFDMVYENYLKRLGENFPNLTISDKKLCAYLKMGLSSKDIAPLLNMSFRSVEMSRHRLRKKLELNRDINLTEFLQNF